MSDTPDIPISDLLRDVGKRLDYLADGDLNGNMSPQATASLALFHRIHKALRRQAAEIDRLTAALAERDATIAELRGSAHQIVGDALVRWGVLPEETHP